MLRRVGLTVGGATLALAIGAASVTAAPTSKDPQIKRLEAITRATAINNFIDIGPPGPSTGDLYVFSDNVFSASDPSKQLGHADGRCTLIDPSGPRFECSITSAFPEGAISTDGSLILKEGVRSTGAIVGGTGAYQKARGEAVLDLGPPGGPHHVTYLLILEP